MRFHLRSTCLLRRLRPEQRIPLPQGLKHCAEDRSLPARNQSHLKAEGLRGHRTERSRAQRTKRWTPARDLDLGRHHVPFLNLHAHQAESPKIHGLWSLLLASLSMIHGKGCERQNVCVLAVLPRMMRLLLGMPTSQDAYFPADLHDEQ
jgi:hypothetical protein